MMINIALFAMIAPIVCSFQCGIRKFEIDFPKCVQSGVLAATIALSSGCPAFAADVGAGETLFNANCAACHVGGQNVIMPEKTLEAEALDQYLKGGRSVASVVTQVTNGKNAMPAFGGRLTDDQIQNVASYVITMSEEGWDDE